MKKSKRNIDKIARELYNHMLNNTTYERDSFEEKTDSDIEFYQEIAKWHLDQMEKLHGQRTVWNK